MILQYVLDEIGAVVDLDQGTGRVTGYPETGGKGLKVASCPSWIL